MSRPGIFESVFGNEHVFMHQDVQVQLLENQASCTTATCGTQTCVYTARCNNFALALTNFRIGGKLALERM
jgi:hypothetical protein